MLTVGEALGMMLERAPLLPAENTPLLQSAGRILRENFSASFDLPRFSNSAMDGYALRAVDIAEAKPSHPVTLNISGRVAAGEVAKALERETCARVFTGSAIPPGADAVVMQEDVLAEGSRVKFFEPVEPGEFVRPQGSDIPAGATLAIAGEQLTFGKIAALSAFGINQASVGAAPLVALLATGSELKEPGENAGPAELFESNRTSLAILATKAGAAVQLFPIVPDDLEATKTALAEAFSSADVVVTTGGASVGELDFVKQAFAELGGQLDFWRINMRPGKPFMFGTLGGKLLCGLPGNPVSAAVTFFLLVRPLLLKMQGASDVHPRKLAAELSEATANDSKRAHYMRVSLDTSGKARPAQKQGSHMLSSLLNSGGLIAVEPGQILKQGSCVEVLLWD